MLKDIILNLKNLQEEFGTSNFIKNIPNFADNLSEFMTQNSIEILSKKVLASAANESDKLKKEKLFDELINMWPIAPNHLKLKIMTVIYISFLIKNQIFLVSSINTIILMHSIKDKEFDKKMIDLINQKK